MSIADLVNRFFLIVITSIAIATLLMTTSLANAQQPTPPPPTVVWVDRAAIEKEMKPTQIASQPTTVITGTTALTNTAVFHNIWTPTDTASVEPSLNIEPVLVSDTLHITATYRVGKLPAGERVLISIESSVHGHPSTMCWLTQNNKEIAFTSALGSTDPVNLDGWTSYIYIYDAPEGADLSSPLSVDCTINAQVVDLWRIWKIQARAAVDGFEYTSSRGTVYPARPLPLQVYLPLIAN